MASVFKRGGKTNRDGYWYIAWYEHNGGRRERKTKCSGTTDKATAQRIANKYEADAALRREGVIDPALESIGKESQRTIESHLADYISKLKAANRSSQYVKETEKYVKKICKAAGFIDAADIEADGVNRFSNSLKDKNKSARTIHAHLTAIKGFTKWLSLHHKLPRDPLASVQKPNPETDRRHERRMLLPDEWRWLEATLLIGEESFGMSAAERHMLYETAIQTGLRSNELRSLSRGRLYFDAEIPYITCKAGFTKNQRDARQYIQRDLAERIRRHIATKLPKASVFGMPQETKLAAMLRSDLASAREAWLKEAKGDPQEYSRREESDFLSPTNHDGETMDFHALRHTCGAWLAMTGVHPKVVQQIMRHSSISLTMDTYGHLFPGQEAEAVSRFGRFMGTAALTMAATGTADITPQQRSAGRSAEDAVACMLHATPCNGDDDLAISKESGNTENSAARCTPMQSSTMLCYPIAPLAQLAEQLTLNQ